MVERVDVAVVGLGAMGSATLYQLAKRGVKAVGLDRLAPPHTSAYGPRSPVFIWMYGQSDTDYFYGFPPMPGDGRVKVATEQYVTTTTADAVDRTIDPAETERMFRQTIEGHLAGVTSRLAKAAVCLYTVTPDRGFIIDTPSDPGQGAGRLRLFRPRLQTFGGDRPGRRRGADGRAEPGAPRAVRLVALSVSRRDL